MPTLQAAHLTHRLRRGRVGVLALCCTIGLLPLACGDGHQSDQQLTTLDSPLSEFSHSTLVRLNTAALARAVQAGKEIQLPFAGPGGRIVNRKVQLTLRNLRSPDLTEFVLKDGDAGSGSSRPLPPPTTYQGKVRNGGVAVFTINTTVVEGSMLVAPDGWSFIEPLEPLLRLRNVPPDTRERLLKKFNHVIYNTRDVISGAIQDDDLGPAPAPAARPQPPSSPLVMSIVADGDAALLRAYPLDSVMPFWLKQESLLNAVDWLYNCLEPEANADNAYADCSNEFDGGSNGFQARVRIDRLEVWTSGGPQGSKRFDVLQQSISMTHQSSPLCCGPPHTAGQSSLVHFFSGQGFEDGAGEAYGYGGINEYGALCSDTTVLKSCHHAVSQLVPKPPDDVEYTFHGNAFEQWALVAHEIGHNVNAGECFAGKECRACWLFGQQCGNSVMRSGAGSIGFDSNTVYLYDENDAQNFIAPRLVERLGSAPSNP